MSHDIFISYSSEDKTVADTICTGLETHNIRCWLAPRDVEPGRDWAATIVDAIEHCRIFVIILSSGSNRSSQVLREVERAVNAGKIVIPVRIEDLVPSKSLGYFLSVSHWFDAITEPLEKHIDELAATLRNLLNKESGQTIAQTAPLSGIDGPSLLSRAGVQVQSALRNQNKLHIIIAILLTIVVLGGGWFFFYERTHQQAVNQQAPMMKNGMMRDWNDSRNRR